MVRKYLAAERRKRGLTQADLASAVGVTRNTVVKLESGLAVDEGIEGQIETALGWEIGSLDAIRNGGKPITETPGDVGDLYKKEIRDEAEQAIMDIDKKLLPEDNKWAAIFKRRKKNAAASAAPVIIPLRRLSS